MSLHTTPVQALLQRLAQTNEGPEVSLALRQLGLRAQPLARLNQV